MLGFIYTSYSRQRICLGGVASYFKDCLQKSSESKQKEEKEKEGTEEVKEKERKRSPYFSFHPISPLLLPIVPCKL